MVKIFQGVVMSPTSRNPTALTVVMVWYNASRGLSPRIT